LHEKATRRSSPHAVHRKPAKPPAKHPHRRSRGTPARQIAGALPVTDRCRLRAKRLEMVPHDLVKDARRGIARLVCARRLRHAPSSGAPRANKRNRSIRRECIDHHGEIEILPTGVAADARPARDRSHVGHLFGAHARCRRAKWVQLPLPIERLRDVNFFSAAVSKMSPRWRSIAEDSSERQERSDSRLNHWDPNPYTQKSRAITNLEKHRESGSSPVDPANYNNQ
jgi:hypothetical protein